MKFELREEDMTALAEHANISIAFNVDRILMVSLKEKGLDEFTWSERKLDAPYVKDYDVIDRPAQWAERFDTSNWGLISAYSMGQRVGGTVIAVKTPALDMLEGRSDLAVLWDLRVYPDFRGQGIGSALIRAAEKWAAKRGCREIKVETQNINLAACRLYERQGFVLGAINRFAYSELPDETQLLWHKRLEVGS
jgi:ribosomal protein S18 acetylase RimI-like enzyme